MPVDEIVSVAERGTVAVLAVAVAALAGAIVVLWRHYERRTDSLHRRLEALHEKRADDARRTSDRWADETRAHARALEAVVATQETMRGALEHLAERVGGAFDD